MQTSVHAKAQACKQLQMPLDAENLMTMPAKLLPLHLTTGCFVLTYLRASYVPGATTDRKPVAKVLLHVLRKSTNTVITRQT